MAQKRGLPHIMLVDLPERQDYTSRVGGGEGRTIPPRVREAHYKRLFDQLATAWKQAESEQAVHKTDRAGIYLEFKGEPGFHLPYQSLERLQGKDKTKCVRLLNVRSQVTNTEVLDENQGSLLETETIATVFVPHAKRDYYFKALEYYLNNETPSGTPKNQALVDSIAEIRKALEVESFWTDEISLIPKRESDWCEVWLSSDGNDVVKRFENLLAHLGIDTRPGALQFPERSVKVVRANRDQLAQLSRSSDDIAEFRLAKETAAFWTDQNNAEQVPWVRDLLGRVRLDPDARVSVCILDTGINNGHPLLSPVLAASDCHCQDSAWGVHDHAGHGTLMAGVAVYGDLRASLSHSEPVFIRHSLESVKILPPTRDNPRGLWGYITSQGVSLAEIKAPDRIRIICIAVSAEDTRDRGRPSSWSAALDQIASGSDDDMRRLVIVCAGNVPTELICPYPETQLEDSIHDPAQSWNALCVGAYTDLVDIVDPTMRDYKPVAPQGGLSPFSTTSYDWSDDWPIKPEIVLEGGNAALDSTGFLSECDDLSLLSTYYDPQVSHFYPFGMTSAATAEAARMAAHIQAQYDNYWPETIRALLVHSAEWTAAMRNQFLDDNSKAAHKRLLRACGYGVPSLDRAMYSASNSLTLIAQSELQPFDRSEKGSGYRTRDMHLYTLPWPREALQAMPSEARVTMRVTLSYFIEPGPGEKGWRDRYRYSSHGLRFDVKSPTETKKQFMNRINKQARDQEEAPIESESATRFWTLGPQARNKGSIHSDIWQGSATDLASSNLISVTPVIGWWRERHHLGKWNHKSRYALIVSISTDEETIDIYTPVAVQVGVSVPVEIAM